MLRQPGSHADAPSGHVGINIERRYLDVGQRRYLHPSEHPVPFDLCLIGVGMAHFFVRYVVLLAVVHAKLYLMDAFVEPPGDGVDMRGDKAFLALAHVATVNKKPAAPQHTLKRYPKRPSGHGLGYVDMAQVTRLAHETMASSEVCQLWLGHCRPQPVRLSEACVIGGSGQPDWRSAPEKPFAADVKAVLRGGS